MTNEIYSPNKIYDVAIIGCGPAGLSAGINAKIRNKEVAIFGVEFCTPRLHKAHKVDNYLGFYEITGADLRDQFFQHFNAMGLRERPGRVDSILPSGETFSLIIKTEMFQARSVILATGVTTTRYLPGEEALVGKGVSYCATCDGALYRGKVVAVLAYDEEALEEANFLAELCSKVYLIKQFEEDSYHKLAPNIQIIEEEPKEILGQGKVTGVRLESGAVQAEGVFIIRKVPPAAQLVPGLEMDNGSIKVDSNMATNIPGVFACGDCTGKPWQLARAVGQGNIAALSAASYLDKLKAAVLS